LPTVLDTATAAGIGLADSAAIVGKAMRGFNLSAKETGRVADVLAVAAKSANTDVVQLGQGLKFVAPIASTLGVSIETTSAALAVLADAGLDGSTAGTGLRQIFLNLASPTKKTTRLIRRMGLTFKDIDPKNK